MSDEDPVKAALAAMENAMAVAAVAAKWHNKAAAHHVQNPENSKQSEIKKKIQEAIHQQLIMTPASKQMYQKKL